MLLYLLIFSIPFPFYWFSIIRETNIRQLDDQRFAVIYIYGIALFVGLGDMLGGYDRYIYGDLFDNLADLLKIGIPITSSNIYQAYNTEFGYIGLNSGNSSYNKQQIYFYFPLYYLYVCHYFT